MSDGGRPRRERDDRVDVRPLALGVAAWAGAWAATSGEGRFVAAAVLTGALLGLASRWRGGRLLAASALVLAVTAGLGWARVWQQQRDPVADLAAHRATAVVEVRIGGTPRYHAGSGPRPAWWASRATLVAASARGSEWRSGAPVEISATGDAAEQWRALPLGATARASGRLGPADPAAGLVAEVRVRGAPEIVAEPGPVDRAVASVRAGLRAACAGLAPEPRALVPALVVGDTSGMGEDLVDRFKTTGLTHLTAVSGANLTLLLVFLRVVAVGVGVRGRGLTAVLIAGVAAFVALCLGEPSVVRAAAMGLVGLVAVGRSGGGRQGLRYLAVAVWGLVLLDPWMSRSIGFALSVTASAGLLWWAGRWTRVMARWMPAWCAEAVAVPLAAQVATQPIVTAISGQVSLAGLVANAVAGPLVGPATVCGFLAAALSMVWLPAASACAWLAGWCAQALCWIARLGDALPGASHPWPATPPAIAVVTVACLTSGRLMPWILGRRWLCLGLAGALVAALARPPSPPGWPPRGWAMASCDVGQGDATVFDAGGGSAVVVDAGPDPRLLDRCLASLGVRRVPLAVLTHLHADHVTGLPAVAARSPGVVLTSVVRSPPSGEAIVQRAGGSRQVAEAGQVWTAGGVRVEILAAPTEAPSVSAASEGESSAENDASVVLKVTASGVTALLAGDTEATGQDRLLGLGSAVDVDVLLVPHHGSARQSPAFLGLTTPQVAVVSVGADNDYGHPTTRTLRLVGGLGAQGVRTDEHGAVAVARWADGRLSVTTQR